MRLYTTLFSDLVLTFPLYMFSEAVEQQSGVGVSSPVTEHGGGVDDIEASAAEHSDHTDASSSDTNDDDDDDNSDDSEGSATGDADKFSSQADISHGMYDNALFAG